MGDEGRGMQGGGGGSERPVQPLRASLRAAGWWALGAEGVNKDKMDPRGSEERPQLLIQDVLCPL